MNYIKGKFRSTIYETDSGYKVGLFRVKETNDEEALEFINKTITFTGLFPTLNDNDTYIFYGTFSNHPRYGVQYNVKNYEVVPPTGADAIIEFLSSSVIKGCGEKTAIKIVENLGDNAIELIKNDYKILLTIPGIKEPSAIKIYNSIMAYNNQEDTIIKLKEKGFSLKESLKLLNKYPEDILFIVENNIYSLIDYIEFNKIDEIYIKTHDKLDGIRVKACIVESLKYLGFSNGDSYSFGNEIKESLVSLYHIEVDEIKFENYLKELTDENKIICKNNKYFLKNIYDAENYIVNKLNIINRLEVKKMNYDMYLNNIMSEENVSYNDKQIKAIKSSIDSNVSIITGGPGTGKTTIINAIVKLYIKINKLSYMDIIANIALLAPTGRASKRMSDKTNLPATTIHRYLKWNKDKDEFNINHDNPQFHKLVIIDETSMIDTELMASLLDGLLDNIKIIFVGDSFQLPSVGPGNILKDLIDSDKFNHINLTDIYRQSENSYIPFLAREIKEHDLNDYLTPKDDYNFIESSSINIKEYIKEICNRYINKGLNVNDIQVLAPMYRGENGIDNLNIILQDLFNKNNADNYIKYNNLTFRKFDKVIQLMNDPDNNVFNGDIGYVSEILGPNKDKYLITVNFEGTIVYYKKEDLHNINLAYAITIHKSQGSEFEHVIIPICKGYSRMLYNKLIYTGVSRAKKSLLLIGEASSFIYAVGNDYSSNRKTDLLNKLMNK